MAEDSTGKPALLMKDIVKSASLLREKRNELESLRREDMMQWAQNREFYRGNQWVYWNDTAGRIETLGTGETQKARYKVRLTANGILPGVQQLVAQMTKTRPVIRATPNSGADRDIKAAEMAERLYEYWWDELGLGTKLQSALVHAQISQGYWLISWDALAGKSMSVMLNPEDGSPIWDEEVSDGFKDDVRGIAEQLGVSYQELIPMFEQTVYMGDVRVQVLSGEQVWLDPTVQNFEDCAFAICKYPMTVDEIDARFGKKTTPDATTTESRPSLAFTSGRQEKQPKNVREVFVMYHKPTAYLPNGKYAVWIEDPDEILVSSDWDFPFDALPLAKFPGIERPGSVLDEARTTHARPIQKEINLTASGIAMHKNLTLRPQMEAPIGSLRQKLTDEPGAVLEYNPIQGLKPEWRNMPALPAYVFDHLQLMQQRLDRIYNIMPTERSQIPARADSGQLVELIQEAVSDQISPEIQRMERSLALAGDLMVGYAQKYYAEKRMLKIKGSGGSVQVKKFMNTDIAGGFGFQAEAGSGLPRTRAGRFEQIKEMVQLGVISPQEAVQYMPVAGLKGVQMRLQADEELGHRRVEQLFKGVPVNMMAMQQAIQQVQTGENPNTGTFFSSQDEAVDFVEEAALSPLPHENMQVTQFIIGQHMKGVGFESHPPDVQDRFYKHYSALSQALGGMGQSASPVKTTLSLKGTVGPTVAADILQQGGIKSATPDTLAEPPLETSVYDSIDKPDADGAGNDPLTDEEKLLALQMQASTHTLKMAKAQNELDNAGESADSNATTAALKNVHAEEMHQARLRKLEQVQSDG